MKKVKLSNGKEIEVKKLTVKDVKDSRRFSNLDFEQETFMVSRSCGIEPSALDEYTITDYNILKKEVFDFLEL